MKNLSCCHRWVSALDFSSVDVFTLLSGSEDHTVMIWDIADEEKGTKEPSKLMSFSATYISSSFDGGYFLSMLFTEKRDTVQVKNKFLLIFNTFSYSECINNVRLHCNRYTKILRNCVKRTYSMQQYLQSAFLTEGFWGLSLQHLEIFGYC